MQPNDYSETQKIRTPTIPRWDANLQESEGECFTPTSTRKVDHNAQEGYINPPVYDSMGVSVGNGRFGGALDQSSAVGDEDKQNHCDLSEIFNREQEEFERQLGRTIDVFVTRMHSVNSRNRHIVNDSTIQTLFKTLNKMHPQLFQYIRSTERCRGRFSQLCLLPV